MSDTAGNAWPYPEGDPRHGMTRETAYAFTCGTGEGADHTFGHHTGAFCLCAGCAHVDGVCVDHSSGGGCVDCESPTTECDISGPALHEAEPGMYDEEGDYIGHLAQGYGTDEGAS